MKVYAVHKIGYVAVDERLLGPMHIGVQGCRLASACLREVVNSDMCKYIPYPLP